MLHAAQKFLADILTCQVCHAFHLVECLRLLPAGGNPSKATLASAACSIVQELDTDCGSSNVVPAPVSFDAARKLPSRKKSLARPELVVRAPPYPCRRQRAKVDFSRLFFFPKWVSKQATDLSQSVESVPMTGGMHTPGFPAIPNMSVYWQLLQLEVPASIALEAARRFPDDFDAALDWSCSSNRRHCHSRLAPCEAIDLSEEDSIPSSRSIPALPAS